MAFFILFILWKGDPLLTLSVMTVCRPWQCREHKSEEALGRPPYLLKFLDGRSNESSQKNNNYDVMNFLLRFELYFDKYMARNILTCFY